MKKEYILWKALCNPEQVEEDERMEQIGWKGYFWAYRVLSFLVYYSVLRLAYLRNPAESFIELGGFLFQFLFAALILVEGGRFLYSCCYGVQEFAELGRNRKKSRGRATFICEGLIVGFWGFLNLMFCFGRQHPAPWIAFALGSGFYWLLCHLAYLYYMLQIESEEPLQGIRKNIPVICGGGLVLYLLVLLLISRPYAGQYMLEGDVTKDAQVSMSGEEQGFWEEIKRGKERLSGLECYQEECFYFTDLKEGTDGYAFPRALVAAHSKNWHMKDGISYCQLFSLSDPQKVVWEYYRADWQEYYVLEGEWVPANDYLAKMQVVEGSQWEGPPMSVWTEPSQVERITKEFRNRETFYTVRYKPDCGIVFYSTELEDGRQIEQVTEHYTLNEFGIVTAFDCEIRGICGDGETPYVETTSSVLKSVNQREIEQEIGRLVGQYPSKE